MVLLGGSSSSVSVEAATMQAETMQVEPPTETELPTSTGKKLFNASFRDNFF